MAPDGDLLLKGLDPLKLVYIRSSITNPICGRTMAQYNEINTDVCNSFGDILISECFFFIFVARVYIC